jgi:O-antigen ligase
MYDFNLDDSKIDRAIFYGIIGLLTFAPLAFGSVHVWAYTSIEVGLFSLLLLWFIRQLVFNEKDELVWIKAPLVLYMALFLVWLCFQVLPLPSSWVALLSPGTHAAKLTATNLLDQISGNRFLSGSSMTLAAYIHPALVAFFKLVAYAGMFFLVLNVARSRQRIDILIYVLVGIGLFEALYGIFQIFRQVPRVWWVKSTFGALGRASGTFISANHYAGYLELIIPLAVGFLIAQRRISSRREIASKKGLTQQIVSWLSPERANWKMVYLSASSIIMGLALLFSGSRGGILSLGISLLFFSLFLIAKEGHRKYGLWGAALCILAVSYGLHNGPENSMDRFERPENFHHHLEITRSVAEMISDYPLVGVGLGNFRHLYPQYIEDVDYVSSSGHAHNDWIETIIETGWIGVALFLVAVSVFVLQMFRLLRKRRDLHALGIGLGVLAGFLSLLIHSWFDFNLHIPANPLTLAAILGLGYAAIHRKGHGIVESFFYKERKIALTLPIRLGTGLVVVVSLFMGLWFCGGHFFAEMVSPTEWNSTMNLNWDPGFSEIRRGIVRNSLNSEYHYKKAYYYIKARSDNETERNFLNDKAVDALVDAIRLNPNRGIFWHDLGRRISLRSYEPVDYLRKWLPLAENCFDKGLECAPRDANMLFEVAWYWVWRSRTLPESMGSDMPGREYGIHKFQELFQRCYRVMEKMPHGEPEKIWETIMKRAVDRVWEYYPDDRVVMGLAPPDDEILKRRILRYVSVL